MKLLRSPSTSTKILSRKKNASWTKFYAIFFACLVVVGWQLRAQLFIMTTIDTNGPFMSSQKINNNNLFPGLVQSGDGWSMWDRQTILSHSGVVCEWARFRSLKGASADMCTYPSKQDRYVSEEIKDHGHWTECTALVGMWDKLVPQDDKINAVSDYYFLDIGANIGSCLVEVLLSTNARIIAFEADPRNTNQITTTLMAQPKDVRDRVAFFPVGLGSVSSRDSVIHQASDNRGNSVVDIGIKDYESQVMLPPIPIVLERLDAILSKKSSKIKIKLIKMDVQGFECNVIDGGLHIFEASQGINTELDDAFLIKQKCSASGLMSRLENAGYPKNTNKGPNYAVMKI